MDDIILQRQLDHEEDLQRLRGFRPMDDTFMRCLFQDNLPLAQFVLQIITGIEDLVLTQMETQKDLKRLVGARSICLDVYGEDSKGRKYNFEVQRDIEGANPERARYHASSIDIENLDVGQDFIELPETYIIFLTEKDVYNKGYGLYEIERTIKITGDSFGDRQHIVYVNGAYKNDDPLGRLMHDFRCNDPNDMHYSLLKEGTRYLKESPEGVQMMCQVMEELREQSIERTRLADIKSIMEAFKITAEQAMQVLKISEADKPKYAAQL